MSSITPPSTLSKRDHDPQTPENGDLQKKQKTSNTPSGPNYFDFIPSEIQVKIVKYLSPSQFRNLQLTCKGFASLKENYFNWVTKKWHIENNAERDLKIQNLYKKIIDGFAAIPAEDSAPNSSKTELESESETSDSAGIAKVNSETSVPVMFKSYQEQMDHDILIFANVIAKLLDMEPFSKAGDAREWLNDPKNKTQLETIENLNLKCKKLTYLPPEIGIFSSLVDLNLSGNSFTQLPPEIGNLPLLKGLTLDSNELKQLPPEIGNLSSLKGLYLNINSLTELPSQLENLSLLIDLRATRNNFTEIPSSIFCLSSLKYLDLSYNKLTELPSEFSQLSSLKELWLIENEFTEVPEVITKCENPKELSAAITKCENLKELCISYNKIKYSFTAYGWMTFD